MRFNRYRFYQSSSATQTPITQDKDCRECAEMKDYGSCTCDPDMSLAQPPNAEGCTFVLGNENAPAQNAKPAWMKFATSNTVRVAEATIDAKRAARAARVEMPNEQSLFRADHADHTCDGDNYGPHCDNPLRQDKKDCPPGDYSDYCLSQVSQDIMSCAADDAACLDKFSQHHEHGSRCNPGEECLFGSDSVVFRQSAETSTCVSSSGPNDCVF